MVDDLDSVKQLEDAGAAAICMNSLFEEQIIQEEIAAARLTEDPAHSFAEALSYFPEPAALSYGPDEYLNKVRRVVEAVDVPVIGSLNGTTKGRWLEYSSLIQEAGAHALELNVYHLATDPNESGAELEQRFVEIVSEVKQQISIPVSVKLSAYYTSLANFGKRLVDAGADGLVLFNRFYQADIDIEELEVQRTLVLSTSSALLLRLRWLAILSGQLDCSFAVSGGVHGEIDAVKAIKASHDIQVIAGNVGTPEAVADLVKAGADAVQMVSALLKHGPQYLRIVRRELAQWLIDHDYDSLAQAKGSMNLSRSPDPGAYERANYMDILKSWKSEL
jgi:dihydroorotate dehydrogenase (fumarate)